MPMKKPSRRPFGSRVTKPPRLATDPTVKSSGANAGFSARNARKLSSFSARVSVQVEKVPRARQRHLGNRLDPPGPGRHHHHAVRQVRRLRVTRPPHAHHDEIVLHHERRALRVQDVTLDHLLVTRPPRPQLSHTRYAARSRGRLTARRSGRCWRACPARG